MWWRKFMQYAKDNYGVEVTEQEAQDSRKAFFELYPGLTEWHKRQKNFARRNGYVRTLTGRKRRLPAAQGNPNDPFTKEAQRQAINSPVQGFAAELNLMAALQHDEEQGPDRVRIVGTVHDAVLWWTRVELVEETVPRMLEIMSRPKMMDEMDIQVRVPIVAEASIGPWGAGKELEEWLASR
jgi:DNA polymerase I-like protein with 3'-5' exonuclease and polymerase domains